LQALPSILSASAALEFFESEGFALAASRTYAQGRVLIVADDGGAEVEIDELGCLAEGVDRFADGAGWEGL